MDQQKEPTLPSISGKNKEYKINKKLRHEHLKPDVLTAMCRNKEGACGFIPRLINYNPFALIKVDEETGEVLRKGSSPSLLHLFFVFALSFFTYSLSLHRPAEFATSLLQISRAF